MRSSAKKSARETSMETPPENQQLPLFFSKPTVVSTDRHSTSGIRLDQNVDFACKTNSIPLTVAEFMEAARHYPIVFSSESPIAPVVLVGLEQDNYYIGEDGNWQPSAYIPAYVRKYPFVFLEVPESDQLMLCVDEDAKHFAAHADADEKTSRLYDDAGKPTEFTQNALNFCAAVQEQHMMTRRFCEKLEKLDLLTPQQSEAKLNDGRVIRLAGFSAIDQEKFLKLSDDAILELHKEGFLPLIHYCFLSALNWKQLLEHAAAKESR